MDYKNLKTYVLSALAGAAMMTSAQAQEIGAQYRDKESAATVEHTFNISDKFGITPRVELGTVSDASLRLDFAKDKVLAYVGAGVIKGDEAYPMIMAGVAYDITDAMTAYANGAAGFGAKEESNEDPQTKINAGLEYRMKLSGKSLALRAGIVDKIGTDESVIGPDAEARMSLDKDDKYQLSAGFEGDTARAGFTYNFGGKTRKMPGMIYAAPIGEKNAIQTVGVYQGQPVIQERTPSGTTTYTAGDTPVQPSTSGDGTVTTYVPTPGTGTSGTGADAGSTPISGGGSGTQTNTENPTDSTTITTPTTPPSGGGGVGGNDE